MPVRNKVKPEDVEKMRRLREEEGLSWEVIGTRFGYSGTSVCKIVRGWKRKPQGKSAGSV